jgi:hypothetical protein
MLPTATRAGLAGKATKWSYIISAGHAVYLTVINNGSTPVECVGGAFIPSGALSFDESDDDDMSLSAGERGYFEFTKKPQVDSGGAYMLWEWHVWCKLSTGLWFPEIRSQTFSLVTLELRGEVDY